MLVIVLLCFVAMPTISLIALFWFIRDVRRSRWLEEHGIETQAHIISLIKSALTRPQFFFVVYDFEIKGQHYSAKQLIGAKNYKRLKNGSTVTIKYSPDNPDFSRLSGNVVDHTDRIYAVYIGLPIAIIWIALLTRFLAML